MSGPDVRALLLESAWISAQVAATLSLVAALAAVVAVHARAHRGAVPPRVRPPGSGVRFAAMAVALGAAALATALTRGQAAAWLPAPLQAVAAATATLACLSSAMLAVWAAMTLGANFAVGAQVRGDAQAALVTGGPFALVRHPLYAALALLAAGTALAWGSLVGLAVVLVAYPPTARWRAALEDEALAAAWPDTWPAYAAKTPRFIPRP